MHQPNTCYTLTVSFKPYNNAQYYHNFIVEETKAQTS